MTEGATIHHGDALDVLATLPESSVDAVVTDPPYGLEFMGKEWDAPWKSSAGSWATRDPADHARPESKGQTASPFISARVNKYAAGLPFQQWSELWAAECLRVLKPGGHLLAFGGTRTHHRLACAIEDAGFEIRDSITWLYGSGFPKSLDVSKAIDKAAGAEREVVARHVQSAQDRGPSAAYRVQEDLANGRRTLAWQHDITAPATPDAERWQGFGTALKPASEPIVVARKPLAGTVAANVLAWGTGSINVDGCRVQCSPRPEMVRTSTVVAASSMSGTSTRATSSGEMTTAGRWPANVVLTHDPECVETEAAGDLSGCAPGCPVAELDRQSGTSTSHAGVRRKAPPESPCGDSISPLRKLPGPVFMALVPVSRFFPTFRYQAKAPTRERPSYVSEDGRKIAHPTCKPLALMRWLVRLVTPPGGIVLDPFAGSGTTAEAALLEGFHVIAVEREAEYLPLVQQRIERAS